LIRAWLAAALAALKDARSAARIQPSARILEHVTGHDPDVEAAD
jgi:hypothetical protein